MTLGLTLTAVLVSAGAVAYLMATDPKRRRAFDRPEPVRGRSPWAASLILFLPGIVLGYLGNWSAFTIWFAAITVIGWGMVAVSPRQWTRAGNMLLRVNRAAAERVSMSWARLRAYTRAVSALSKRFEAAEDRVAELERRVAGLEQALAAATSGDSGAINQGTEHTEAALVPREAAE